jgi:hypothetical protein
MPAQSTSSMQTIQLLTQQSVGTPVYSSTHSKSFTHISAGILPHFLLLILSNMWPDMG